MTAGRVETASMRLPAALCVAESAATSALLADACKHQAFLLGPLCGTAALWLGSGGWQLMGEEGLSAADVAGGREPVGRTGREFVA